MQTEIRGEAFRTFLIVEDGFSASLQVGAGFKLGHMPQNGFTKVV